MTNEPSRDVTHHALGRRERRRVDVRERIKRAARDLFLEKGYESTTVEEIAERADIAKGTFFNHFPRKDALLLAFGEEMLNRVDETLGPVEEWTGPARRQVLRLFLELARQADRDRNLFRVMLIENLRHFFLREEADEAHEEFREILHRVLERARAQREIGHAVDLAAAVRLLEAVHVLTTVEWIKRGGTEEELRREIAPQVDIIFRGLAGPPERTDD